MTSPIAGTVHRKLDQKGYGFILGDDHTDYFFHYSSLDNISFEVLCVGDRVSFLPTASAKGPRAETVVRIAEGPDALKGRR